LTTAEDFKEQVERWADEIGVPIAEIHIRDMRNKWASCSAKGRLTFDRSLLDQRRQTRLEVILHELLHVRYPNHGRMFKRLLRAYLQKAQATMGEEVDQR